MNDKKTIHVLIADDSQVVTELLQAILQEAGDIKVIGHAKNGQEAVKLTQQLKPDLVTMDIHMPIMDGFAATQQIMMECPTPIVVISSRVNDKELNTTYNALRAGALTVIEKPHDVLNVGFAASKRSLLNTIRALSEVHVIRRRQLSSVQKPQITQSIALPTGLAKQACEIVALGISTGGPEALHYILAQLPQDFPVPIVVVQHITKGFLPGLLTWLQRASKLTLEIARDHQLLYPGHVYFAPDDYQLAIQKAGQPLAVLEGAPAIERFKPSITYLFNSLAKNYPKTVVAGLLTGMGQDGAQGLLAMKKSGSYTFIQSKASCVVFGMPGKAQQLDASCDTVELANIPQYLIKLLTKENTHDTKNIACR